jgi:hypothetical protein
MKQQKRQAAFVGTFMALSTATVDVASQPVNTRQAAAIVCLGAPVGSEVATRLEDVDYSDESHKPALDSVMQAIHGLLAAGTPASSVRIICTSFTDRWAPSRRLDDRLKGSLKSAGARQRFADVLAGTARVEGCRRALQARLATDSEFLAAKSDLPAEVLIASVVEANQYSLSITSDVLAKCPGKPTGREVVVSVAAPVAKPVSHTEAVKEAPEPPSVVVGPPGPPGPPGLPGPAGGSAPPSVALGIFVHAGASGGLDDNFVDAGAGLGFTGTRFGWRLQSSVMQSLQARMVGFAVESSVAFATGITPIAGARVTFVAVPWGPEVSRPSTNTALQLGVGFPVRSAPRIRLDVVSEVGIKVVRLSILRGASEDFETKASLILGLSVKGAVEWRPFSSSHGPG